MYNRYFKLVIVMVCGYDSIWMWWVFFLYSLCNVYYVAESGLMTLQLVEITFLHKESMEAIRHPPGQPHISHNIKPRRLGIHHQEP